MSACSFHDSADAYNQGFLQQTNVHPLHILIIEAVAVAAVVLRLLTLAFAAHWLSYSIIEQCFTCLPQCSQVDAIRYSTCYVMSKDNFVHAC